MSAVSEDDPVFIGGIAGTGKTRLGSLLGRHPHISVTRKTYLWRDHYGRYGDLDELRNRQRCCEAILAGDGLGRLSFDRAQLRDRVDDGPIGYGELFGLVHRLHAEAAGKPRWCDQLGLVEAYADPIFETFPRARMIHMVCDPRSLTAGDRPPGVLGWIIGKWLTSVRLADRNRTRFPGRYLVIRREDFEADEKETMRKVCDFIDEPLHPTVVLACRAPRDAPGPPGERVSERFIESSVGGHLGEQGYAVGLRCTTPTLRTRLIDDPANRLGLAAWHHVRMRSIDRQVSVAS